MAGVRDVCATGRMMKAAEQWVMLLALRRVTAEERVQEQCPRRPRYHWLGHAVLSSLAGEQRIRRDYDLASSPAQLSVKEVQATGMAEKCPTHPQIYEPHSCLPHTG